MEDAFAGRQDRRDGLVAGSTDSHHSQPPSPRRDGATEEHHPRHRDLGIGSLADRFRLPSLLAAGADRDAATAPSSSLQAAAMGQSRARRGESMATSSSESQSMMPGTSESSAYQSLLPSTSDSSSDESQVSIHHDPGMRSFNWNGPGEHGFTSLQQLMDFIGDGGRYLTRREELCILQNAQIFATNEVPLDAEDDPNRPDHEFVVVNRPTFLQMGVQAGMDEAQNKWPGYKSDPDQMTEEKRISTLKINDETFIWRHHTCGQQLLRRRLSLDKDEGPFEDESLVYYLLQYHKLPNTKKSIKARILHERADKGRF